VADSTGRRFFVLFDGLHAMERDAMKYFAIVDEAKWFVHDRIPIAPHP